MEQWDVYFVLSSNLCLGRDPLWIATEAIRGGVQIIQLREKSLPIRDLLKIGKELRALTREYGITLLINDRLDLALAIEADGVHLGQNDFPAGETRTILGPQKIVGVTVKNPIQARHAVDAGADYLGVGPAYATTSKEDAGQPGLWRLIELKGIGKPLVAIGGINHANAGAVVDKGATAVAVMSAISAAPDPREAAQELGQAVRGVKAKKR